MTSAVPLTRLFEPIDLGRIPRRTRIMLTTRGGAIPSGRYVRYLEARAAGGVGLVAVSGAQAGVAHISSVAGRFLPSYAGDFDGTGPDPGTADGIRYFDEQVTPMLRQRAEGVHRPRAAPLRPNFPSARHPTSTACDPPTPPAPAS